MPVTMFRPLPALLLLAALALGAPAPASGARPSVAGLGLKFASGSHARIPFELRNGHVWVRGVIGGSDSLWIMVDTGASSSVMDVALARSLGFALGAGHTSHGAAGPQPGWSVENVTLQLPGLSLHRDRLEATELASISAAGARPTHLIIGYELFAACVVRFDYPAGMMDVWDAAAAPGERAGVALRMTLVQNHPYVDGVLAIPGGAPLRGRFVIDTGSSGSLILGPDVVDRENLRARLPRTLEIVARGVGGELHTRMARADSFSLGALRFDRPLVALMEPGAGRISAPGTVGNIGGQLLGRCRVTFDYPRREVRFEPAAGFDRPFEADMSGATLLPGASAWSVRLVNPGTPADEAGLRAGDAVTAVDGVTVQQLDPMVVREWMKQEGRVIPIAIRRGERDTTVSVRLRRIL